MTLLFLLAFMAVTQVFAGTSEPDVKSTLPSASTDREIPKRLEIDKEALPEPLKKMSTDLRGLLRDEFLPPEKSRGDLQEQMRSIQQFIPAEQFMRTLGEQPPTDVVYVYISLKTGKATGLIDPYVWKVVNRDNEAGLAVAWVSVDDLEELAAMEEVRAIRTVHPPVTRTGSVTSEGDELHRADQARDAFGYDGSGIKVGVISDGVDHWTDARDSGDLPDDLTILRNNIGGDEGTAMLEIVHDLAPGADLFFHDSGTNILAFNNAISALVNAGCDVIVDDIGWYGEPYFEDGIIAQHVSDVIAENDIVYVSAAGNNTQRHYQGEYHRNTAFEGEWHDFSQGEDTDDPDLYVNLLPGETIRFVLQWDDPWGSSGNDYDLYLADVDDIILDYSKNVQDGTGDPLEFIIFTNTSTAPMDAQIWVEKSSGQARELEIYIMSGFVYPINLVPEDSIFGHPAVPEALAVGAVHADEPEVIAGYSSLGPSTIAFPQAEKRDKPDICGIAGVQVTGAGDFPSTFYGTSAAAPHIAAVAALTWSAAPEKNGDEIRQVLLDTAEDMGASGFNYTYGYGLADALEAISEVIPDAYLFNLDVKPEEGGTATDLTDDAPYEEGAEISIKAEAAEGYEFDEWTAYAGTFEDTEAAETIFTMPDENVSVVANFKILASDDDPQIVWAESSRIMALSYEYSGGFLVGAYFYTSLRNEGGAGEVTVTAVRGTHEITETFDVKPDSQYTLKTSISAFGGQTGSFAVTFSSPSAETDAVRHGNSAVGLGSFRKLELIELGQLSVNSSNPSSGVFIYSNPENGIIARGVTPFSSVYRLTENTKVHLEAPLYHGWGESRKRFDKWTGDLSSSDRSITFTVGAAEEKNLVANYIDDPTEPLPSITGYAWNLVDWGDFPKGPATIEIPKGTLDSLESFDDFWMSGADFVEDTWYAVSFERPSRLFTINTHTGELNLVGSTGINDSTGLAYDSARNTLYLTNYWGGTSNLYTINLNTGEATLVGPISSRIIIGIAADASGNLYGLNQYNNSLYSIDKDTGAATLIGSIKVNIAFAQDIAYDRINDVLYGTLYRGTDKQGYQGALYYIDVASGAATFLNLFGDEVGGFAIPYEPLQEQFTLNINVEGQGFTLPTQGEHVSNIEMYVDGLGVNLELPLVQYEGEILTPWRKLSEVLGLDVAWLPATEEVVISNEDTILRFRWGKKTAYINDEPVEMPVAPFIIQGNTIGPAWFLVNTFGYAARVEFELRKYEEGDELELYAEPYEGWAFEKWVVNGTEHTTPEITITMDSDKTALAVFQAVGTGSITHVVLEIGDDMVVFTIGAYGSALAAGPGNETYDYMAADSVPMVRAVGSGDKYIGIGAYGTAFAQEGNTAGAIAAAPAQDPETVSGYLVFDGFDGDGQPILTPLYP